MDPPLTLAQAHEKVRAQYKEARAFNESVDSVSGSADENGSESGEEDGSESEDGYCKCCGRANEPLEE